VPNSAASARARCGRSASSGAKIASSDQRIASAQKKAGPKAGFFRGKC
jgi:hypothetical protein